MGDIFEPDVPGVGVCEDIGVSMPPAPLTLAGDQFFKVGALFWIGHAVTIEEPAKIVKSHHGCPAGLKPADPCG
jgi:hypothetical protein